MSSPWIWIPVVLIILLVAIWIAPLSVTLTIETW